MSALDDAIAKAQQAPPIPFAETTAGRQEAADQALSAFCTELLVKLPQLGIASREVWYVDHDSWGNPPPRLLGQGWPLVAFGLMVDGQTIVYSDAGPHGGSVNVPGARTLEHLGRQGVDQRRLFHDAASGALSYRPPGKQDYGGLSPMRSAAFGAQFPTGRRYPLADAVAAVIVTLMDDAKA